MSSNPWFKFFPSDWIGGTVNLTPSERGVYITLLAMIYEHGGSLPRDDARLARACGMPKAGFAKVLHSLISQRKIEVESDGSLTNNRAKTEVATRGARIKSAKENAIARWDKTESENAIPHDEKTKQNQQQSDATAPDPHMRNPCYTIFQKPEARDATHLGARQRVEDQASPPHAEPSSRNLAAELVACLPPMSGWPIATTIVPPAGISRLIAEGCDIDRHVLPAVRQVAARAHAAKRAIASWAFFEAAIRDAKAADKSLASAPPPFEAKPIDDDTYRRWLIRWRDRGDWPTGTAREFIGPPPGSPDCRVPQRLIDEQQVAA
jgi:uncharacterized protein YdaU (DUF1376 family)